jgi:surfactin synthase thioesterase subunit
MSWFRIPQERPHAAARLFCLPPAGAAASIYWSWSDPLGPGIEVHAVQLPGRENRFSEPPVVDPAAVAAALTGAIDRPYALFGHSLGGRLAFEVIRLLRADGVPLPQVLYVAGSRAPDLVAHGPLDGLSRLSDQELLARLVRDGSLPPHIAAARHLWDMFVPMLRADFGWIDNYRYTEQPPLPVPIVAVAGSRDRAVPADQMTGWRRHTSAGFVLHKMDGDHFFPQQRGDEVAALIHRTLPAAGGQPPAAGGGGVSPDGAVGPGTGRRVALGGWSIWPDALLRTTGFAAHGLDRFVAPQCAAAADGYLDGSAEAEVFDKLFGEAVADGSAQVRAIAADPMFREAVTWQNPAVIGTLDALVEGGRFRPSVARHRELTVIRYWQRYCAKNETIGFFGPVCWARVDGDQAETVRVRPGEAGLLRQRRVCFETWALEAYGQVLAADPQSRMWLRPVRQPHLHLAGGVALRPPRPPERLSRPEQAALDRCDGSRTAAEVVDGLGLPKPADGVLLLERLVERGLLRWDADLPLGPQAESVLAARVAAIGDPAARQRARDGWHRLRAARDAVAAAAGDPGALATALARLDTEFTGITGGPATRRAGQTYAGRRLCFEDTARDLDVRFGPALLRDLAAPLELLLRAARWLCAELARAYQDALRDLYAELGTEEANLAELWFLAQGMLFGGTDRPVDRVVASFQRRWAELLGLPALPAGTAALSLDTAELAAALPRVFPECGSGWSAGRLHSPDLQICAPSEEAVNRGDYTVVLGELHIGWAVFDNALFAGFHPRPADLVDELAADLGPDRVRLLYPPDWPRYGGRLAQVLAGPTDIQLGFAPAPGADRDRLVPIAALTVRPAPGSGQLVAHAPDGRSWPLLEVFSSLLAIHTVDSFKLLDPRPHTPRISLDRLVVSRQTWRTTVAGAGLADVTGDRARFLAARRWRARLGLPERVFIRLGTETKPFYVDFRSPHYVRSLCSFLRSAAAGGGGDAGVVVTEMLPTPDQAWVPDADGNRYFSELRLQVGERHG